MDDDKTVRVTVRDALEEAGYHVLDCADGSTALRRIATEDIDLLLTDIRLPDVDGITLFRELKRINPAAGAILMTAYGKLEDAVTVMREGARDYIVKPFEIDELVLRVGRILREAHYRKLVEGPLGSREDGERKPQKEITGNSAVVRRLLKRIDACASSDVNALITGETGTGKDLCAQMIHFRGKRASFPFVTVNCAAIPENLLESEFFGYERGAFTGAEQRREGRFKAADGGTLLLDEVGALPLSQQAKILRAIETGQFEPLGTSSSVSVDVRVIAATNQDLKEAIKTGQFREDLYFRLNVVDIYIPSLRERWSDIPILVREILQEINERHGIRCPELDPAVIAALCTYDYPGNVRELLHALEHAVVLSRGKTIMLHDLPASFTGSISAPHDVDQTLKDATRLPEPLSAAVGRFEQEYIQRVIDKVGGHRGRAAKILGISRKSLWQKLREDSE